MTEAQHTPEPWFYDKGLTHEKYFVAKHVGDSISGMSAIAMLYSGSDEDKANARRIVACVNSCAGLPTEALEKKHLSIVDGSRSHLYAAAPKLLEACDLVQRAWVGDGVEMAEAVDACLLAIAKAGGQAA